MSLKIISNKKSHLPNPIDDQIRRKRPARTKISTGTLPNAAGLIMLRSFALNPNNNYRPLPRHQRAPAAPKQELYTGRSAPTAPRRPARPRQHRRGRWPIRRAPGKKATCSPPPYTHFCAPRASANRQRRVPRAIADKIVTERSKPHHHTQRVNHAPRFPTSRYCSSSCPQSRAKTCQTPPHAIDTTRHPGKCSRRPVLGLHANFSR